MQVSVEKVSNVERRLTIVVPAQQMEDAYTKQINKLAKTAKLDGFRPGKVPENVLHQRFGEDARKEAMNEVIQAALSKAISDEQLIPVSIPRIETKMTLANQPLEFVVSFEVLPEMGSIQFSLDSIEKLNVAITDEDINHVIQQLQKQYTKWDLVDRPAQEKDRVVIDYYAIFEGKSDEDNKVQNLPVQLGSQSMMPGFEESLIGAKAGDQKTLQLNFPADFPEADKAGKPIEFVVEVKQIFSAEEPKMDEEFIKKLGISSGSMADLKDQIRKTLEHERDRSVKERLKEQVFSRLLEQNPLEIPNSLIEREAKYIHDEIYKHDHNHNHSEEENITFSDIAKKRVGLGLLISEYAKQLQIKPDKARVLQLIQDIASAYEQPKEVIAWLSSEENRKNIEAQVIEEQVMEKLIEGVPVNEKNISYAELKGYRI